MEGPSTILWILQHQTSYKPESGKFCSPCSRYELHCIGSTHTMVAKVMRYWTKLMRTRFPARLCANVVTSLLQGWSRPRVKKEARMILQGDLRCLRQSCWFFQTNWTTIRSPPTCGSASLKILLSSPCCSCSILCMDSD
ncbi:unnamed protein product [Clavelina lepadiformis]|uniref:Uncharacterized protein n=1 Tax=Clavelina lepadiformis TaxID=159417 RepID=A0ABP0GC60_CLALP